MASEASLSLACASGPAGAGRVHDAMRQVVVEQPQGHRLQRLRHGRDLGEDVNAVLILLNHALQAPCLTFDPAQPFELGVLARMVKVAVLMASSTGACGGGHLGGRTVFRAHHLPPTKLLTGTLPP